MKTKIKSVRIVGLMLVFAMLFSCMGVFAEEPEVEGNGILVQDETKTYYDENGMMVTEHLTVYEKDAPFNANQTARAFTPAKLRTVTKEVTLNCNSHATFCRIILEADFYYVRSPQYAGEKAYVNFGGYAWDYYIMNGAKVFYVDVIDHNLTENEYSSSKISVDFEVSEDHGWANNYKKNITIQCNTSGNAW